MGVKEGEVSRQGNVQRPTSFGLLGPAWSGPQHHSDEKTDKYKPTFLHVDPSFVPDVPIVRQIMRLPCRPSPPLKSSPRGRGHQRHSFVQPYLFEQHASLLMVRIIFHIY